MLRILDFSLLAVRLLLAAIFLLAGATKLVDPAGSRKALREFGLPWVLARPMLVLLPAFELAVAAALIPTALAWYGAWGALALLTLFLIAVGTVMARGHQPDCHCFGQLHSAPVGWPTLLRNAGLAACAAWLAARGQGRLGPGVWASFVALDAQQRKIALVAAGVLGFVFLRLIDRARPRIEAPESEPLPDIGPEVVEDTSRRSVQPRPTEPPRRPRKVIAGIGHPMGTPAPPFELTATSGETCSLQGLLEQKQDVLLIFTSPYCEPCQALSPLLVRWMRELDGLPTVVFISRGTREENLSRLKDLGGSRVLLQEDFEIAEAYDTSSTPTAVLVGADGSIRSDLAMGAVAIKKLLLSCAKPTGSQAEHANQPLRSIPTPR